MVYSPLVETEMETEVAGEREFAIICNFAAQLVSKLRCSLRWLKCALPKGIARIDEQLHKRRSRSRSGSHKKEKRQQIKETHSGGNKKYQRMHEGSKRNPREVQEKSKRNPREILEKS